MNRLTRITSILIQLQSKRIVTAKEIARRFEVSLRTIYRDIKTLQEAGVPIGSENGTGYFIVDGYNLPSVMITEEEANAMLIAEKLIQLQGDTSLMKDFDSFIIKIKSILRYAQKENLNKLESRISQSSQTKVEESNWLSTIQKTIINASVISILYLSIYKDEETERLIEPLGLYFTEYKVWVVIAYCRLRKELREFRLDRILDIKTTLHTFDYKEDFSLTKYFQNLHNSC